MKMRTITIALVALIAVFPLLSLGPAVHAATPPIEREQVYANDQTFTMLVNPSRVNGTAGQQQVAQDLYLVAFPLDHSGNPILPPGYSPQCNPCFHPGVPTFLAFHDHVLEGAPGFGTSGTAGSFNPIWHAFVVIYDPAFVTGGHFVPVKSGADLDAGVANHEFINLASRGGIPSNPFELDTGVIFLCIITGN